MESKTITLEINEFDKKRKLMFGNTPKPSNEPQWQNFMRVYGYKTSKELGAIYGVSASTIRGWAQEGRKKGY